MDTDVRVRRRSRDAFWLDWIMLAASLMTVAWLAFLR